MIRFHLKVHGSGFARTVPGYDEETIEFEALDALPPLEESGNLA